MEKETVRTSVILAMGAVTPIIVNQASESQVSHVLPVSAAQASHSPPFPTNQPIIRICIPRKNPLNFSV